MNFIETVANRQPTGMPTLEMCTPTRVVSSATELQTAVVVWKAVLYGANFFRAAVHGFPHGPQGADTAGVPGREQWGRLSAAQLTALLAETA
ncbi:hypothetical protein [Amycolatopsis sp. NPDC021455]|uniref:hypothetical protein n=1 Tax=Amycolatopsis sp. NPDC021455 TaxID=3154901 RepID=UPI0033D442B9